MADFDTLTLPTAPTEIDGHLYWSFGDRLFPYITGAAEGDGGDGGGDASDGGDEGGDGDGGDPGGDGDGEPDWKARARQHERAAKKAQREAAAAQKRADALEAASQDEGEKAIREAQEKGRDEARTELAAEIFQDRIDAAILRAAGAKFADPDDAVAALRDDIDIDDDGRPDPKDVEAAVADLLKRKPYLAAEHTNTGDADGGPRGGGGGDDSKVAPGMGRMRSAYAKSAKNQK